MGKCQPAKYRDQIRCLGGGGNGLSRSWTPLRKEVKGVGLEPPSDPPPPHTHQMYCVATEGPWLEEAYGGHIQLQAKCGFINAMSRPTVSVQPVNAASNRYAGLVGAILTEMTICCGQPFHNEYFLAPLANQGGP